MNNNSKLILGILAAGVVGVAIGMLLAPEKGSDLRSDIKESIDEFGNKVNDLLAEGKEKIRGVASEIKTTASHLKEDTQAAVDHSKKVVS